MQGSNPEEITPSVNVNENSSTPVTTTGVVAINEELENNVTEEVVPEEVQEGPRIVQTDATSVNGQDRCPRCGATDIILNVKTGKLRCTFCRCEFDPVKVEGMVEDINALSGTVIGSGAQNIIADTNEVMTFKCESCGAEVVIDTASSNQARCHWCRHTLSVNQQIPNGSIPDVVLPFIITKEEAQKQIESFVGKRKFFANTKFKEEFTTNNIMGVYFPYMVVDVNSHANFVGQGEHQTRQYVRKVGDTTRTYYDADLYDVEREFDLAINGLTVESNSDRLDTKNDAKTNNIINSIMPFDIENCVKYNSNYLKGFTSERRDTNIEQLQLLVDTQAKDVARFAANVTLTHYDRGVFWKRQDFSIKGEQWKSAYLPVWLYSYQQVKGDKKVLHYVAVNARTKETMGSVPINYGKLILISIIMEIIGIIAMIFTSDALEEYSAAFLATGPIYYFLMYSKYRNKSARHNHETETKNDMSNLRKVDNFKRHETGLSNSHMIGANNTKVEAEKVTKNMIKEKRKQEKVQASLEQENGE